MTNTELLEAARVTPGRLFTGLEKQQIMPMPCPSCGTLQNQLEAAGITLDEYSFGSSDHSYHCTGCRRELTVQVPFIALGPRWHWGLVPDPALGQDAPRGTGAPSSPRTRPPAHSD